MTDTDHEDWVGARLECDIKNQFARLREHVRIDNEKRMADPPAGLAFEFRAEGVSFRRLANEIQISAPSGLQGPAPFTAVPVQHEGECRFWVSREEEHLRVWQLSRLALEPLFFPER